jgi:peptidoglycan-associated lipoprotein
LTNTGDSALRACLPESVYFSFDEFVLSSEATDQLQKVAECLRAAPATAVLTLEGHCDPRGTDAYNLSLGERRSQAVKTYLERLGTSGDRLRTLSKGKLEATGTSEETWAKDRRVDFITE